MPVPPGRGRNPLVEPAQVRSTQPAQTSGQREQHSPRGQPAGQLLDLVAQPTRWDPQQVVGANAAADQVGRRAAGEQPGQLLGQHVLRERARRGQVHDPPGHAVPAAQRRPHLAHVPLRGVGRANRLRG